MGTSWRRALLLTAVLPGFLASGQGDPLHAASGAGGAIQPAVVAVILMDRSLHVGALIQVTVANGLRQTIYTEDAKSDCSIVTLQRWSGQTWAPLDACALGRAPRRVAIAPGEARSVALNPRSVHFQGWAPSGRGGTAVDAGTYRIKFGYRLAPDPEGETTHAAYSEVFRVGP